MKPAPFYLWRHERGRPAELVAIVQDEAMAMSWVWNRAAKERRRWTRHEFGWFGFV